MKNDARRAERLFLAPLAAAYQCVVLGRSRLYERRVFQRRKLKRPVISVGNISAGGAGKTPLVALLAQLMLRRGMNPAILTRGYKRRRGDRLVALAPDPERRPNPRLAGDEPAWLAATLPEVPIVICADRFSAGKFAEETYAVDVHLIDDGFQHLHLARDLDLVALDATQGLAGQALLPAGRLREPPSALRRADLVVLTRTELVDASRLEEFIERIHPGLPLFHSRVTLRSLFDVSTRTWRPAHALEGERVYAFCGIGNPEAFFSDLKQWGFQVVGARAFRDHHLYGSEDTTFLALTARHTGATALITTEKDLMNLPTDWQPAPALYACVSGLEIKDMGAFEKVIFSRLHPAGA